MQPEDHQFRKNVLEKSGAILGTLILLADVIRNWVSPVKGFWIVLVFGSMFLGISMGVKKGMSVRKASFLLVFLGGLMGLNAGFLNGGMIAPATALFSILPIVGFFTGGGSTGLFGLIWGLICIGVLVIAEKLGWTLGFQSISQYSVFKTIIESFMLLAFYGLGAAYEKSRELHEFQIRELERVNAHQFRLATLGEMSAAIAHELSNPLTVVLANIASLNLESVSPAEKKRILSIQKATDRMLGIARGMQKFSRKRPSSSSSFKAVQLTSLNKIIAEAIEFAQIRAHKSKVEIISALPGEFTVFGDSLEIEQVILNLVNNSIDAVRPCAERWVKICCHLENEDTVLRIIDSGPGVPPDFEEKIFQPFFTTKGVNEGTGLGLSICKNILDSIGARIFINRGIKNTCFEIQFPTKPAMTSDVA